VATFSIVIPCYNQGAFLGEALKSIAEQTVPVHQVIVVDDGSTDPFTIARIDELCQAPIELVRQANGGLPAARNAGIRRATGDWILPLDADDQLTPNALEVYERAIAADPEIDIWYPDILHFGVEEGLWESGPFANWRLLWNNQMVCSSAIRRAIFTAGITYNERMRGGYEDWEFYIHACCDRGHKARALEQPIFRYRRWGYSMLSASNERAAELKAQIQRERPIFSDEARLIELKRAASPFLSVSTRGAELSSALAAQETRDFRICDETGRVLREGDLRVFRGNPGRMLMVSLADDALATAFRADRFLLEKMARVVETHDPALLWLMSAQEPGQAYPGFLFPVDGAKQGRCLGFAVDLRLFFAHPAIPRGGELLDDLARFMDVVAPGRTRHLIVGSQRDPKEGVALPASLAAERAQEMPAPLRERLALMGQGLSRITRGVIGPGRHDVLWQRKELLSLQSWLDPSTPMPGPGLATANTDEDSSLRAGPIDPKLRQRERDGLWMVTVDEPRLEPTPPFEGGLLLAVPWMTYGGADRAVLDLVKGLESVAPGVPRYLLTTVSRDMVWADELLPHLDGVFSLADHGTQTPNEFFAGLIERLNIRTLLIANSQAAYDALPALRKTGRKLRVVSQLHGFDRDPKSGKLIGYPVYAASRYNNLIDAYAPISKWLGDKLISDYYVSPAKVKPIHLGIDSEWFSQARRRRFAPGERLKVLWLGRLSDEKDPLTALRVASAWRARHGVSRLHFILAGSGPLDAEVRRMWMDEQLNDVLTLVGPTPSALPYYRAADCLMLTSRYEGIPLVIYEAMAAGLPVVTPTHNTSIPEVLPASDAYFIEHQGEVGEYLAALEQICDGREEASRRADRMAQHGKQYTRERYAREMMEVLFGER
jgi:glycosyltransferase involved in cell wall biosynthesis